MAVPNAATTNIEPKPSASDRIADAVRHAAHLSHEARLMKSMARDAGEDGVHAARRALRRVRHRLDALEDLKDDAAHYVKHQPFKSVGIAFGVGLQLGVLIAWLSGRIGQRRDA
jgi:ElaB/YqjD/DUF883 family membrane-anchored ribosome-binding protein